MNRTHFTVTGMTDTVCSGRVEKRVGVISGVEKAKVNLLSGELQISYDEALVKETDIVKAVLELGFGIHPKTVQSQEYLNIKQRHSTFKRLILTAICTLLLLTAITAELIAPELWNVHYIKFFNIGLQIILTIICLLCAASSLSNAFKSFFKRKPNLKSFVTFTVIVLFLYSLSESLVTLTVPTKNFFSYYWLIGLLVLSILLEDYLTLISNFKNKIITEELKTPYSYTATVLRNGIQCNVAVSKLKAKETISVLPGSLIPVDAVIINGSGSVDESVLTGNNIPVPKKPGDTVYAGTLNKYGTFLVETQTVPENFVLSEMNHTIIDQLKTEPENPFERIGIFLIPITILSSLIFGFIIFAFSKNEATAFQGALAISAIACPCTLGLCIPLTLFYAQKKSAAVGISVKSTALFRKISTAKTFIFEQAGIVTAEQHEITDVVALENYRERDIIAIALSAEEALEQVFGDAIVEYALKNKISAYEVDYEKQIADYGVQVQIENKSFLFGTGRLIAEENISIADIFNTIKLMKTEAKQLLYLVADRRVIGMIAIREKVRADAITVIQKLNKSGMDTVLVTTNPNEKECRLIQKYIGCSSVETVQFPEDRVRIVCKYQGKDNPTVFIGSGAQSAVALCNSDVGISVGNGSKISAQVADAELLKDSLEDILHLAALGKITAKVEKRSIFFGLFYNICLLPIIIYLLSIDKFALAPLFMLGAVFLSAVSVLINLISLK